MVENEMERNYAGITTKVPKIRNYSPQSRRELNKKIDLWPGTCQNKI